MILRRAFYNQSSVLESTGQLGAAGELRHFCFGAQENHSLRSLTFANNESFVPAKPAFPMTGGLATTIPYPLPLFT